MRYSIEMVFHKEKVTFDEMIGPQRITLYGGDLVIVRYCDPFHIDEAQVIIAHLDRMYWEKQRLFGLADVSRLNHLPQGVRSERKFGALKISALAFAGMSFTTRVAINMMVRAGRLLKKDAFSYPLEFFQTEAEATKWLGDQALTVDSSS